MQNLDKPFKTQSGNKLWGWVNESFNPTVAAIIFNYIKMIEEEMDNGK